MTDLSAESTEDEVTGPVITLVHTHAGGTMAEGTSRGDGSGEILKAQRWRWSRDLGAWYIRYSRDRLAKRWELNAAKEALEAAGFAVEIVIDEDDRRPVEEREAEIQAAPKPGRNGSRTGRPGCGELLRVLMWRRAGSATASRWVSRSWSGITPSRATVATSPACIAWIRSRWSRLALLILPRRAPRSLPRPRTPGTRR